MSRRVVLTALLAGGLSAFQACGVLPPRHEQPVRIATPPAPPPPTLPATAPLLISDGRDARALQTLAKELDALSATCGEKWPCERVYYHKGLLAVYESRVAAAKFFQKVILTAPKSRLAASSAIWLQILQDARVAAERDGPFALGADQLVRELVERELAIYQAAKVQEQTTGALQELQEAVAQREKKLKQLSGQLEALKQIDQELKEKARPR